MPTYGTTSGLAAAGRLGTDEQRLAALGASSGFGAEALGRERNALQTARGEAGLAQQAYASTGANPFAAAREAQRGLAQQQSQIRAQTTDQLSQMAAAERQRQEAERLRKQGEARQMLGGLLSTGGAVLGSIVPGIGTMAGGGLGSAVGGLVSGGSPPPGGMQSPSAVVPSGLAGASPFGMPPPEDPTYGHSTSQMPRPSLAGRYRGGM